MLPAIITVSIIVMLIITNYQTFESLGGGTSFLVKKGS